MRLDHIFSQTISSYLANDLSSSPWTIILNIVLFVFFVLLESALLNRAQRALLGASFLTGAVLVGTNFVWNKYRF